MTFAVSDQTLQAKINDLFECRYFFEQCNQLDIPGADRVLDSLVFLQGAIYGLDSYFESSWHLCPDKINQLWSTIFAALRGLDSSAKGIDQFVSDVHSYQILEEDMRYGNAILGRLSLRDRYRLKTCDVRLSRALLLSLSTKQCGVSYNVAWDLFDLAAEIVDDLQDWQEDISTFNGNQLLVDVGLYGTPVALARFDNLARELREDVLKAYSSYSKDKLISTILDFAFERIECVLGILAHSDALARLLNARRRESHLLLSETHISLLNNNCNVLIPATVKFGSRL